MNRVLTGLDILRAEYWKKLKGRRLGLLSNQASLDYSLTPAKDIITGLLPGQLTAIFGPQHGHSGEDQDNMIETDHSRDVSLDLPVYSLYSSSREPLPEMLDPIDVLIIDLQDVGTRVYTFASTMLNCLKAAAKAGKKVLILDRPNPVGGEIVEGNLLMPEMYSFVGPFRLPMRHGLTMGELALLFKDVFTIDLDLEIIELQGWTRNMVWHDTGLPWLMPSPNMPIPETAYVYPGQVIWEGTHISEGRGTCRPFELFGAPYLDTTKIKKKLDPSVTAGCHLQEVSFRPTFNKWEGELCYGFMIHIQDIREYRSYMSAISILSAIIEIYGDQFQWKEPPYEYEYDKMPIDLILGDTTLRKDIESGENILRIGEKWLSELKDYLEWRRSYLIYT